MAHSDGSTYVNYNTTFSSLRIYNFTLAYFAPDATCAEFFLGVVCSFFNLPWLGSLCVQWTPVGKKQLLSLTI
jgi:hypothetical protein